MFDSCVEYRDDFRRIVTVDASVPLRVAGDPRQVAVEGYPGQLAFELIGWRSYNNCAEYDRLIARKNIVDA